MRSNVEHQAPALAQLMGAYFHQDWYDSGTEDDVVDSFLRDEPHLAPHLADEIAGTLSTYPADHELDAYLRSLGSAYNPARAFGSTRAWLREIARRARAHSQSE
jgi:hypothetical protein